MHLLPPNAPFKNCSNGKFYIACTLSTRKDTLQNVSVRFHHRKPSKDPPPHSDSRPKSLEGPPPVFFPLPAPMTFLNPPGILFSLCTYAPDKRASLLLLQPAKHLPASGPWQARPPLPATFFSQISAGLPSPLPSRLRRLFKLQPPPQLLGPAFLFLHSSYYHPKDSLFTVCLPSLACKNVRMSETLQAIS